MDESKKEGWEMLKAFTVLSHKDKLHEISGDGTLQAAEIEAILPKAEALLKEIEEIFKKTSITEGIEVLQAKNHAEAVVNWLKDAIITFQDKEEA